VNKEDEGGTLSTALSALVNAKKEKVGLLCILLLALVSTRKVVVVTITM